MHAVAEIHAEDTVHHPAPETDIAAPDANPIGALVRMMRGRWLWATLAAAVAAPGLGALGYMNGVQLYQSQAILRVYPQESNILYQTGDGSVLKTFDSFVKAETTYVAADPVMDRAADELRALFPRQTEDMSVSDLAGSIEIRRNDSLIILKTMSRDAAFSAGKLDAVIGAYMTLKAEAEEKRSAVRLAELLDRETELLARQRETKDEILAVGGEFGLSAIAKAHVEKIAQIDALTGRRAEVAATLVALEAETGGTTADMADQEILRATLLDRALADLNFERAKRQAELSTLLTRYAEKAPIVRDKRRELEVIERAMEERREQIKVLSQTGALTDQSEANAEESLNELRALLEKVGAQLAAVREEARVLNKKQLELRALEDSAEETRDLLDETRKALEVIRLEAGRALPGFTVVMSPPSVPADVTEDSSKMLAAGGFGAGGALCFALAFALAIMSGKLRHSDDLGRWTARLPLLSLTRRKTLTPADADRLRNALQLHRLRAPHLVGRARVISVVRPTSGEAASLARELAESFARARLSTLLIDMDQGTGRLTEDLGLSGAPGWRDHLAGLAATPLTLTRCGGLSVLPVGTDAGVREEAISVGALRDAVPALAKDAEVVVIHAGSMTDTLTAELALSVSDLGLAEVHIGDRRGRLEQMFDRIDTLPRQGGALTLRGARRGDPGLPA